MSKFNLSVYLLVVCRNVYDGVFSCYHLTSPPLSMFFSSPEDDWEYFGHRRLPQSFPRFPLMGTASRLPV